MRIRIPHACKAAVSSAKLSATLARSLNRPEPTTALVTPQLRSSAMLWALTPVDLELDGSTAVGLLLRDGIGQPAHLRLHVRNEGLATESRVDAHHQDQIHVFEDLQGCLDRRGRVEHNANAGPCVSDGVKQAVQVRDRFHVHAEVIAPASM